MGVCYHGGSKLGFQTTYEELKLEMAQKFYLERESFQTTYEELKPIQTGERKTEGESFQTTYEELKLGHLIDR